MAHLCKPMTMASQALWIKFNSFTELQGSFDLILSLTAWPLPIQAMSNHIQFPQFPECTALSLRTTLPSSSGQLLSSFMSQLTCSRKPSLTSRIGRDACVIYPVRSISPSVTYIIHDLTLSYSLKSNHREDSDCVSPVHCSIPTG